MSDIWAKLEQKHGSANGRSILSLFDDPDRFEHFSAQTDGMLLDFSKTSIDPEALDLLLDLARTSEVPERRDAMFRGDKINTTENRAVLHTALRADNATPLEVDGSDIRPEIAATLRRMEAFCEDIRPGDIAPSGSGRFTDVVNIGIGGSDLGPAMATLALAPYHDGPRCHFVSNVDGAHIADTLRGLDPRTTLVIVASKTFTTIETMANARTAFDWLQKKPLVTTPHLTWQPYRMRSTKQSTLVSVRIAFSASPIGLAGGTRSGARLGCRSCWLSARRISVHFLPAGLQWTSIFRARRCRGTCQSCWHWSVSGTAICVTIRPVRSCPTTNDWPGFRPIFNSLKWKVTARK